MRQDTTTTAVRTNNVIDFQERRFKRTAEQSRLRNQEFAKVVLDRWSDNGPASGQRLFSAILTKVANGPFTREQAEVLLPVLLEVLDVVELRESEGASHE